MSENGEIYTAGNKFYTPAGTDGMDKFHLWDFSNNWSYSIEHRFDWVRFVKMWVVSRITLWTHGTTIFDKLKTILGEIANWKKAIPVNNLSSGTQQFNIRWFVPNHFLPKKICFAQPNSFILKAGGSAALLEKRATFAQSYIPLL